ncbi:hypothetical protein [Rhizobium skierniewicense]|uniref:hypothetical protein n=1 Tax=Rhizobium skierniewicense TaxID=984260 RepID=UPI00157323C7|nr:hypothetical protein [Rhizobium skierniewicense]NTF34120.1 hypothetical protein [Rhizobium skierniewicense]
MDSMQIEIARFLAEKAMRQTRATYQQVGDAVGWNHPTGRGLGKNLEVVLHALHDRGLPPLTTILVKRGERHPAPDAMEYIRGALGDIDIETAQNKVFAFDWGSVPDLAPDGDRLPTGRDLWLTSFWGFDPAGWGCIGFADAAKRKRYLRLSSPNALVAIYVTKGKGPEQMRGKVVGVLEMSHNAGHASQFIAGDRWAEKEMDPASRGKWLLAVQATRAWRVVQEDWQPVERLFPIAYASAHAEYIGSSGVQVGASEAELLLQLDVYEVPVYGQMSRVDGAIQTLESALSPSRAIPPATEPYWVGETDGPKHLYILELSGDTSAYLGRPPAEVDGRTIIKVGFSRSPSARRDQIQSAYPNGQFKWVIKYPQPVPDAAPYSSARVAIVGEDAMKRRLVTEGAEVLGGEFFLVEDWLIHSTWSAGKFAASKVMEG